MLIQIKFQIDYIHKILIVLSATSGVVCTLSSVSVGAPVGIEEASFTLMFSLTTGIIKKQETTKSSMIKFLCWLKAN